MSFGALTCIYPVFKQTVHNRGPNGGRRGGGGGSFNLVCKKNFIQNIPYLVNKN